MVFCPILITIDTAYCLSLSRMNYCQGCANSETNRKALFLKTFLSGRNNKISGVVFLTTLIGEINYILVIFSKEA